MKTIDDVLREYKTNNGHENRIGCGPFYYYVDFNPKKNRKDMIQRVAINSIAFLKKDKYCLSAFNRDDKYIVEFQLDENKIFHYVDLDHFDEDVRLFFSDCDAYDCLNRLEADYVTHCKNSIDNFERTWIKDEC